MSYDNNKIILKKYKPIYQEQKSKISKVKDEEIKDSGNKYDK